MGNREGVVSLKSFFSTVKGIFGFDNAEKEIDSQTEKEVAALKAESEILQQESKKGKLLKAV